MKSSKDSPLPKLSKSVLATYSPSKEGMGKRKAIKAEVEHVEAKDWNKYGVNTFEKFLSLVKDMNSVEEGNASKL